MNCIIFEGARTSEGYGRLRTPKWGTRIASRAVLAESLGRKLERHEFACHTCDTPACVNIDHLYLGDAKTNMQDKVSRGRGRKTLTEEHRRKLSVARLGKPASPAHREAISRATRGKPKSPAHREATSRATRGVPKSLAHREAISRAMVACWEKRKCSQ